MLTLWSMVGPCLRSLFAWNYYYYYYYYYYDHTIPLILIISNKDCRFSPNPQCALCWFPCVVPSNPSHSTLRPLWPLPRVIAQLLPLARVNHGNVHSQIWRQNSHFKSHTSHLHFTIWPPALVYLLVLILSSAETGFERKSIQYMNSNHFGQFLMD